MLEQHLASTSPDLLREMIASFANAMMSARADDAAICTLLGQHMATYSDVRASAGVYPRRKRGCAPLFRGFARSLLRCSPRTLS